MITWRRRWLSLWHVDRSVWTYTSRIQRNKHESWLSGSGMTPWVLRMEDRNVDGNVAFSTAHFFTFTFSRILCILLGFPYEAQLSSVAQSCPTLCDAMNRSTPGLPVHHQLPESTQTHVHRVGDAIQPSYPLLSPSPPTLNLSQHQGLFQWVSSSQQVAKVLKFQLQHQTYQWTPQTDLL